MPDKAKKTKNVKILIDGKEIFNENLIDINLNISRDVKSLYHVGEFNPYDLVPSAVNNVVLSGKFIKILDNKTYTF